MFKFQHEDIDSKISELKKELEKIENLQSY